MLRKSRENERMKRNKKHLMRCVVLRRYLETQKPSFSTASGTQRKKEVAGWNLSLLLCFKRALHNICLPNPMKSHLQLSLVAKFNRDLCISKYFLLFLEFAYIHYGRAAGNSDFWRHDSARDRCALSRREEGLALTACAPPLLLRSHDVVTHKMWLFAKSEALK